jgi:hypothetical protein
MKVLAAILILVLSALSNSAVADQADEGRQILDKSWAYTCSQLELINETLTCDGLEPPIVVVTRILSPMSLYGVYIPGERYVFVNPDSPDPLATLIHEMTHYVLYYNGIDYSQMCLSEEIARFVAGQTGNEWRKQYGCTKEH